MSTNPNDRAFARPASIGGIDHDDIIEAEAGLTKREYFAAMAMAGMLAAPQTGSDPSAVHAVSYADDLIDALNAIAPTEAAP